MSDLNSIEVMPEPSISTRARWWLGNKMTGVGVRWRSTCDRLRWMGHKPGNLERHAHAELAAMGQFDKSGDFYGGMMGRSVMELVRLFAEQGHSGMSAGVCVSMFEQLARFKPLGPLTGTDDEWHLLDYDGDVTYQNKRCSHVFKGADGRAYDSQGRVFRDPSGACYTSSGSRVYVEFPYTPKVEYVDVPE